MENRNQYENLNFRRWVNRQNRRLIIFIISILGYLILMWILPESALVTILLFIVPVLIWVSSYGWRTALTQVIRYLQRFQIN
jgi:predicted membrane protein